MTQHKHLKQLVRARMQKTGESYSAARRQIVQQVLPTPIQSSSPWHFPGIVPAAAGLRVLFTDAGILAPHTGQPLSEPMVFGIAGGIGAGVFAFHYEKEDFSSFFIAGRHLWQDEVAYTKAACERVGLAPVFVESSGAKSAEKQLLAALDAGPVLAWVDMAHLPHRALPKAYSGMMYHLITVYDADPAGGTARIGDAADEPIEIPLAALAEARGRIKSQKHRLLQVTGAARPLDLSRLVKDGLRACHEALTS
ncbi:MAG TPA: BtrH N-terminal domain-containing protein, partial [Thermoanaerobaculia bacterium]|nr:BtrH N-terminal domain-containing protein [Thermoanaerobaculia bacterium]